MNRTTLAFLAAAFVAAGPGSALAADATEAQAAKKININQASASQLAFLPRVGAKAAERIVEYRKAHGGNFGRIEELMEVKGVGEKLFQELKPYVALSGATTLSAKVRSGSSRGGRAAKKSASSSVPVGKGR
ncbi:MAG: helix-hairpin-helix domain-containing protein [Acidobacteriota bacterium]